MDIYDYTGYFNDIAYEILKWSCLEFKHGNRIKASKIKKCAEHMEYKYRKYKGYPLKENVARGQRCTEIASDVRLAWLYKE